MKRIFLFLLCCCLACPPVFAGTGIRLPGIFSSHMVFQRQQPVRIWGWADSHTAVEASFGGRSCKTRANGKGEWELMFPSMEAGGPYTLTVRSGEESLRCDDILVGEVWLCSGQSNMEWPVAMAADAEAEIAAADHPEIRAFNVPKRLGWNPCESLSGAWEVCSPATAPHFSAVAYYFAREIREKLGVPVGIINASWGGTAIESWIGAGAYLALPVQARKEYDPALVASVREYSEAHPEGLDGYSEYMLRDPGLAGHWYSCGTDDSEWDTIPDAGRSGSVFADADGLVWFRRTFDLPAADAGEPAVLHLGRIDDSDITWVNGVEAGRRDGHAYERKYPVPRGVLKAGRNTVAVRITDELGPGGFMGKPGEMYLETAGGKIPLSGEWKWRASVVGEAFYNANLGPNSLYSMLCNAMVAPLVKFRIRGTVWYQGESNVDRPEAYRLLFPALIEDWRSRWGYDFPFYWVQLPNYMAKDEFPSESGWAGLREAQDGALSLPQTGQAVTVDLGEADNLHPCNKQEVGRRLARIALKKTYGMPDVVCSGPVFVSAEFRDGRVYVSFAPNGSGLEVRNKYGYIEGFAVAGADGRFVWAKAYLEEGRVVVFSDDVAEPVCVRFEWGNNPDVNLYNTEGLPAAPFRAEARR